MVEKSLYDLKQATSYTSSRRSLWPIVRIVLESGALNTAYLITYIVLLDTGDTLCRD